MRISEKFNSFNGSSRYVTQQDLPALHQFHPRRVGKPAATAN